MQKLFRSSKSWHCYSTT